MDWALIEVFRLLRWSLSGSAGDTFRKQGGGSGFCVCPGAVVGLNGTKG
ncbi:MAG: hypothetical protein HQL62_01015 [Magnetococcales bacterium]|nr:hypothetical protein [Magnetococcales bacterium]